MFDISRKSDSLTRNWTADLRNAAGTLACDNAVIAAAALSGAWGPSAAAFVQH